MILAVASGWFLFFGSDNIPGFRSEQIARVTVSGFIAEDRDRDDLLAKLAENTAVKAVIVSIDSTGGVTAGGEALYEGLRRLAAEKPTVATVGMVGASAALIMTAEQRIELEREIRAIERKLRGEEQDFREELNIQKNNEFKKVRLSVMEAINQLAKEEGFDLILSAGVLFSSKRFDLTENILEYMQRNSGQQPANN